MITSSACYLDEPGVNSKGDPEQGQAPLQTQGETEAHQGW